MLDNYIFEYKREGEYDGEFEFAAICKIYKLRIIFLILGFYGYNVYNILCDDDYDDKTYHTIYLLYKNKNHFYYLNIRLKPDDNVVDIYTNLDKVCKNNLEELTKLRKKEFPISYKWHPNTYNEIYNFYKYNRLPESSFKSTTNPSLYESHFKELAYNSFILQGERLYYIKQINLKLDIDKSIEKNRTFKKIPYVYEVLTLINDFHNKYVHISYKNLAKKYLETEYYIDSIEI